MSVTFNSTTPAATAGNKNITWQKDGSGNVSGEYDAPFSVGVYNRGVGANADVLFYNVLTVACKFPSGAATSQANAKVAATGSTTFTFKKNGSSFATVVFSASGTVGAWTQGSDATFNGTTDLLEIDGPGTADATLANFGLTLQGFRT